MLLAAVTSGIAAHAAYADVYTDTGAETPSMYSYAWREPGMISQVGIGVTLGGGLTGFTDQAVRNVTTSNVGGLWSARATIGTHIPIGLDLAYNGTAVDVRPLGAAKTGTLVGTNVEAALRWNVLPHYMINPYLFAGIGWQRYDVTNANYSMADVGMADKDNLSVFPMGAGVAYRDKSGLVLDVRGTFRAAPNPGLIRDPSGGAADLHTWDAGANLGYEF
jgi:hypothetical protein